MGLAKRCSRRLALELGGATSTAGCVQKGLSRCLTAVRARFASRSVSFPTSSVGALVRHRLGDPLTKALGARVVLALEVRLGDPGCLGEAFPEVREGRRAASRILHHPPVAQSIEHFRAGSSSVGRPAPDFVGADVGVFGGQ